MFNNLNYCKSTKLCLIDEMFKIEELYDTINSSIINFNKNSKKLKNIKEIVNLKLDKSLNFISFDLLSKEKLNGSILKNIKTFTNFILKYLFKNNIKIEIINNEIFKEIDNIKNICIKNDDAKKDEITLKIDTIKDFDNLYKLDLLLGCNHNINNDEVFKEIIINGIKNYNSTSNNRQIVECSLNNNKIKIVMSSKEKLDYVSAKSICLLTKYLINELQLKNENLLYKILMKNSFLRLI